ncbi:hypothetical protein [Streptomonospora litoralis]|uniref:Uncharacterized protein n=1 Tax=Streptomonospora litoralis TaxID=2498135 RepID=A0A4P6Q4P0_9ACTN|nr:hypothetical protein [Streptomonospora litoralis]QBI54301.1 hypothetical protein EKD16_12595 [Streptomonospora litoralis]
MSPKKKRTRTKASGRGAGTATPTAPPEASAARGATPAGVSRTPVVLDDRRRWPVAVWIALTCLWALGSLVFFGLFLAEGFALMGTQGRNQDSGFASMNTAAWYLLGLVVCALAVPLAGAVWALLLRRRIAAILFAVALALSAALLFSLDSPVGIAQAVANGITAG